MRFFIRLSYLGAPYCGWQIQPGVPTVQAALESALGTLLGVRPGVTGAGRTDTGVNARLMVAHFDLPDGARRTDVCSDAFLRSLNSILGRNIAVHGIFPVADDAHARFDATERTYRYYVHTLKDPFLGALSLQLPSATDFDAMNTAGDLLLGRRDFTSFSKLHTQVKTNVCDLREARWHRVGEEPGRWYFRITADRFLRNMVRAVVGTLLEVGRGKMRPEGVLDILEARDRCAAGTSMPPEPLFLWDIKYGGSLHRD